MGRKLLSFQRNFLEGLVGVCVPGSVRGQCPMSHLTYRPCVPGWCHMGLQAPHASRRGGVVGTPPCILLAWRAQEAGGEAPEGHGPLVICKQEEVLSHFG